MLLVTTVLGAPCQELGIMTNINILIYINYVYLNIYLFIISHYHNCVTKYHRLGGLSNKNLFSYSFRG